MKKVSVALVGCGTVGSSVVKVLREQKEYIAKRHGVQIELKKIYTRTPEGDKSKKIYDEHRELFVKSLEEILEDPEISIVIETVGGLDFACEVVEGAIVLGKDVVTANKEFLNYRWLTLFSEAAIHGVTIGYEAAVAGAIPIVNILQNSLVGNQIQTISGILNGTTNYILTEMEKGNGSLSDILQEAQVLGYAEVDPHQDISGKDARNKLAILMRSVFGLYFFSASLFTQGIEDIILEDFEYADKKLNSTIRLIAFCTRDGVGFVCPMFISKDDFLAKIPLQLNGIKVTGDNFEELSFIGPGAGGRETASSIVADLVNIAKKTFSNNELNTTSLVQLCDFNTIVFQHTLRFIVNDEVGIIRDISSILADEGISIKAIEQNEYEEAKKSALPFLITLDPIEEGKIQKALKKINELKFLVKPVVVFRSFV